MTDEPMHLGPVDPEILDALWGVMQPLWTDEGETLLRVVETDPEWVAIADSFHDNFSQESDPRCPECGAAWNTIYMKIWQKGDFLICIDSFYCKRNTDHRWTRSTGPNRRIQA
ncbi:hypothetical protein [[Mycobacterium] nativiensis]|uniref:Transposase n=1 Tax=[Mycobacterium] nativiensis TaxID=2855503 RepID=A0ABU5XWJ1_9MYCO|nr:hypothetical protein [Mycolicibacter sp. MYC340]MEB3032293.1 hypothetical protein [Mycolicibacter sp. MYC340]